MANWRKLLKSCPRRLGATQHLDEVLAPDDYQQPAASGARKDLGYPWEGIAGRLEIREWSPGNLIAVYVSWSRGIAKRSYYNGSWLEWRDAMGQVIQ